VANVDKAALEKALSAHTDKYTGRTLGEDKVIQDVLIEGGEVSVKLQMGYPCQGYLPELVDQLTDIAKAVDGVTEMYVEASIKVTAHTVQKGVKRMERRQVDHLGQSGAGIVGRRSQSRIAGC